MRELAPKPIDLKTFEANRARLAEQVKTSVNGSLAKKGDIYISAKRASEMPWIEMPVL